MLSSLFVILNHIINLGQPLIFFFKTVNIFLSLYGGVFGLAQGICLVLQQSVGRTQDLC